MFFTAVLIANSWSLNCSNCCDSVGSDLTQQLCRVNIFDEKKLFLSNDAIIDFSRRCRNMRLLTHTRFACRRISFAPIQWVNRINLRIASRNVIVKSSGIVDLELSACHPDIDSDLEPLRLSITILTAGNVHSSQCRFIRRSVEFKVRFSVSLKFLFVWRFQFRCEKSKTLSHVIVQPRRYFVSELQKMQLLDLYNYMSHLPRYHVFLVLSVGYLVYYLIEVVKVRSSSAP